MRSVQAPGYLNAGGRYYHTGMWAAGHEDAPPAMPRWLYGYGMFQAAACAADSLVLLLAATVLGGSPQAVGLVDALGSIGTIGGAFILSLWLSRIRRPSYKLHIASILALGIALVPFAFVDNMVLAFLLAFVAGLLLAPSSVYAPMLASANLPRSLWGSAFGWLNKASSLGGAAGIAIAALWLTVGERLLPSEAGVRLLFILLGALAVLAALWSRYQLAAQASRARSSYGVSTPERLTAAATAAFCGGTGSFSQLSDRIQLYFVSSFLMFAGFGMSYSGVHTYLASYLKAPLGLVMASLLGFRLFSYIASGPAGKGYAEHFPMQVQSMTVLARAVLVLLVALLGLLAPAQVALPLVLVIVTLWGVSAGVLAVSGVQSVARLSSPGRWGRSQALYIAVINASAILGAWLGGVMASYLGFNTMFLMAALLMAISAVILLKS